MKGVIGGIGFLMVITAVGTMDNVPYPDVTVYLNAIVGITLMIFSMILFRIDDKRKEMKEEYEKMKEERDEKKSA